METYASPFSNFVFGGAYLSKPSIVWTSKSSQNWEILIEFDITGEKESFGEEA